MEAPNARSKGRTMTTYKRVGDHLKLRYEAIRGEKGWIEFSPSGLHIELNGQPLTCCQEVVIVIKDGFPTATLTLNLEGIDIDADTLTRLAAFIGNQEPPVEEEE